tara:strand:- start:93 stop:620 length:528 start_codon:yes stop_codon:yes gene_type:complete
MPAKDTFFLRKTIDTNAGDFVSGDIDISAYTDPARGRVLVIDRGFITYMSNGNGPITATDVGTDVMRTVGVQVTTESKTGLVDANDNSLVMHGSLYVTTDNVSGNNNIIMYEEVTSMNPMETTNGFIVPTDKIQCALDVSTPWADEISVGFVFEVHTEKLSLKRIQELLVSLTAN